MKYIYSTITLVFGAVFVGAIAHELFHVIAIQNASAITFRWGSPKLISVCCLSEQESAMENVAYFIQALVTLAWIVIGTKIYKETV